MGHAGKPITVVANRKPPSPASPTTIAARGPTFINSIIGAANVLRTSEVVLRDFAPTHQDRASHRGGVLGLDVSRAALDVEDSESGRGRIAAHFRAHWASS
ncbi:MAG TPA: hypothetical protein VK745_00920 [Polyangiaceae bacterium]|nr:hypothetical protein [Polyangiaceae bacterium]